MNNEQLKNFESIPTSGLESITSTNINEVSEEDILNTGNETTADSIIDEPKEKKKNIGINKDAQTTPTKLGNLVGGELGVRLLDIAMPALIVTTIHYVGYKIDRNRLKLTNEDRKVIAPLMQDALNAIEIDFNNPFVNLAFGLSIVYGTKLIEEIPNLEKRSKGKPAKIIEMETKRPTTSKFAVNPTGEIDIEDIPVNNKEEKIEPIPLSGETLFRPEFDKLLKSTMATTGRKSRRGAMAFLFRHEPHLIKNLLDKFGLKEVPASDKDYNWVKDKNKDITKNFEL